MFRWNPLRDRPVPKEGGPTALPAGSNIGNCAAPKRGARRRQSGLAAEPQGWRATFMSL